MFVKDMVRLLHHADPSMPKSKKVSHLMCGVKEQLFAGLVRNPQTTVDEFTKEATGIKWALQQCHQKYNRLATCAPAGGAVFAVTDEQMLRQLIPEIAKENVRQAAPPQVFTIASVTEEVRQELRQAFAPPEPHPETHLEMCC